MGDPGQSTVMLMKQCTSEILSCCGVPPAIHDASAASASREGYAQFLAGTMLPLGRLIAAELSEKLEGDVKFGWDALATSGTQGRARATKSLVDSGFSREYAARVNGFPEPAGGDLVTTASQASV